MDSAVRRFDTLSHQERALTTREAGDGDHALVLEARRRHVPSIGLQHGFIYRHWLNYRHEPDEMEPIGRDLGCLIP